jgi:chitinase
MIGMSGMFKQNSRNILALLLAFTLISCAAPTATPAPTMTPTPAPPPFRIVAYATEGIVEALIPYDKLTHINYSFLTPKDDGTFNTISNGWKLDNIVKNGHQQNVKVLISVGGWGWDKEFETVAADPTLRMEFVKNLKAFVELHQLDGVDIDWEYPDPGQSSLNFLALIRDIRTAMPDKLISAAVVAYGDSHGLGIPPETFEYMDYVVVMAYSGKDHGTMDQFNKGVAYWNARGLPQNKLVIGLPFYSEPGGVSFAKLVKNDPASAQSDTSKYLGATEYYNGIPTIQIKTRFALEHAGGVAFWTLDMDAQGELSLVNAIYQTVHTP